VLHPLVARTVTAVAGPLSAFARAVAPRSHPFATDPYLQGPNAPRRDELELHDLWVDGEIPAELHGVYVRNGPNPQFEPLAYSFPFDGDGMIHAVELCDGRASYRNRWVTTAGLRAERRAGRAVYGSVKQPFPVSKRLIGDDGDASPVKNAANTNVIAFANRFLALYEGGLPYQLDAQLDTIGTFDFGGRLTSTMTAHPKVDPLDGSLHFFRYAVDTPLCVYYVADAAGTIVRETPIPLSATMIVHDCLLTEHAFVLVVAPLIFDLQAIMRGKPALRFEPQRGTEIIIVDRADSLKSPQRIRCDGFYFWHYLNGYEAGHMLVVDLVVHASMEGSFANDGPTPSLVRLAIDTHAGTCRFDRRDERCIELPRVTPGVSGRAYRYGYAATAGLTAPRAELPAATFDGLIRYDMDTNAAQVRSFGPGRFVGEPAIVPKYGARAECEAFVMTFCYDAKTDTSTFIIIDGADFTGEPVATVRLPVRVPNGYHGSWVPAGP
jgi:carotenoid cleavage dioxygenase-like enzyme